MTDPVTTTTVSIDPLAGLKAEIAKLEGKVVGAWNTFEPAVVGELKSWDNALNVEVKTHPMVALTFLLIGVALGWVLAHT